MPCRQRQALLHTRASRALPDGALADEGALADDEALPNEALRAMQWPRIGLERPEAGALWPQCVHRSVIVRGFMDAKNLVSRSVGAIASLAGPSVGSASPERLWTKHRTACPRTHSAR